MNLFGRQIPRPSLLKFYLDKGLNIQTRGNKKGYTFSFRKHKKDNNEVEEVKADKNHIVLPADIFQS